MARVNGTTSHGEPNESDTVDAKPQQITMVKTTRRTRRRRCAVRI